MDPIVTICRKIVNPRYNVVPGDPHLAAFRMSLPQDIRDTEDILCACFYACAITGSHEGAQILARSAWHIRERARTSYDS